MADKRVYDVPELTTPADNDFINIIDVSDATDSPEGSLKKIQKSNLGFVTLGQLRAGAVTRASNTIVFDLSAYYGSPSSPRTGNITMDETGAISGLIQVMFHNSATVPTFGTGVTVISGEYQPSTLNRLSYEFVVAGTIYLRIRPI